MVLAEARRRSLRRGRRPWWIDGLRERVEIAARFHGEPSRALTVTGVTGTNGKTSTINCWRRPASRRRRAATARHDRLFARAAGTPASAPRPTHRRAGTLLAEWPTRRQQGDGSVFARLTRASTRVRSPSAVFTSTSRATTSTTTARWKPTAPRRRGCSLAGLRYAVSTSTTRSGVRSPTLPAWRAAPAPPSTVQWRDPRHRHRHRCARPGFHGDATPKGRGEVTTALLGRATSPTRAWSAPLGALGVGFCAICDALAALRPVNGRMSRPAATAWRQPLVVVDMRTRPDALEQALLTCARPTAPAP